MKQETKAILAKGAAIAGTLALSAIVIRRAFKSLSPFDDKFTLDGSKSEMPGNIREIRRSDAERQKE